MYPALDTDASESSSVIIPRGAPPASQMTILWHDITGYLADPTAVLATALLVCLSSQLCAVVIVLLKALLKLTGAITLPIISAQSPSLVLTPLSGTTKGRLSATSSCMFHINMFVKHMH